MTVQELVKQIEQLSIADRLELFEILKQQIPDAEDEAIDIHEEFRQAWHEAMTGEEIPLSQLWDSLNDE